MVVRSLQKPTVLLVNTNQMKPAVAPIALDYLGHALKEAGFAVDLLDLCFASDTKGAIARYFSAHQPDLVGITLRNTDDTYFLSQDFCIPRIKATIDLIKSLTHSPIVLGGVGFSVMPEAILDFCQVDLGIWGEGEACLTELAFSLAAGKDYSGIPGLVYRTEGGVRRNPVKYFPLAKMTTPARDFVDNLHYFTEGGMGSIETKRGCNQGCIYCADPLAKGRRIRWRSPTSVTGEVEWLLSTGIDHLHLCDSEFNLPEVHAREVCLAIIERGLGERVRWYTYACPVPFSDELALLMKKAGCVGIDFGVDSGIDEMLKRLGRSFTVDDLARTAEICHCQGLTFMYDLLLGGPGETKESLKKTIELMKRLSPDRVGASLGVRLFPGTKLARMVLREGTREKNGNLHGYVEDNASFFAPIFYLSSALGPDAYQYLTELIGGDSRFFVGSKVGEDRNYNYNDNSLLVEAIKAGYRGAFWDILRRLGERGETDAVTSL